MHTAADSGCSENAQLMCERSNYGLCWLQRKSWHGGDARVMDVLLGLMHRWRRSGEPYIPVRPSVGRNLSEIVSGRSPTTRLLARNWWAVPRNCAAHLSARSSNPLLLFQGRIALERSR